MELSYDHKVVYGLFETRAALETAVGRLKAEGFSSSDISTLLPSIDGDKEFNPEPDSKANEDSAVGAAGGAVLGGALGWLAGIGTLSIPGLGPFVAAGPILALLGGAGLGGALGGIAGALVGMGLPENEAKHFESVVQTGGLLLSVHAGQGDWMDKAKTIFKECGAHDVSATTDTLFGSRFKDTSIEKHF